MSAMNIKLFLPILLTTLTACQSISGSLKTVDVYRSDNARQCEKNSGITPETMRRDLGDIHVYQMRKDYLRGMMFPTVCGGATGSVNVYTIDAYNVQAEHAHVLVFFHNKNLFQAALKF